MGLDEIIDGQWNVKLLAEIDDTIDLMLAASIGEQDEGNVMIMEVL